MEREQHELYEYARKRLNKRKNLTCSFYFLVSLFLYFYKNLDLSLQTGIYG
jgi:hypothetical protein